jgi:hypothetical protein
MKHLKGDASYKSLGTSGKDSNLVAKFYRCVKTGAMASSCENYNGPSITIKGRTSKFLQKRLSSL